MELAIISGNIPIGLVEMVGGIKKVEEEFDCKSGEMFANGVIECCTQVLTAYSQRATEQEDGSDSLDLGCL